MTEKLYLGRLLRTLREERMLTQGDVAEILHVSRQHYSRFENDQETRTDISSCPITTIE